ncbi:hypothetical protein FNV43_RR10373 [Rhamnella rubrinervis]|uniref:Uncharacterized protein n=1 Tax=Rhamnella rubrinervis TaxID=2594499 RepID=A0A8K0HBQ2_9ROSA|nr:hypothetical protein FNV43_RR10373 [Rhamnella rubrinervis]
MGSLVEVLQELQSVLQWEQSQDGDSLGSLTKPHNVGCMVVKLGTISVEKIDTFPEQIAKPYNLRFYPLDTFPSNLSRLALMWSGLHVDQFESLQPLPNLVQIELIKAYDGEALSSKAGGFKMLKILDIAKFERLRKVTAEKGTMPCLEQIWSTRTSKILIKQNWPPFKQNNQTPSDQRSEPRGGFLDEDQLDRSGGAACPEPSAFCSRNLGTYFPEVGAAVMAAAVAATADGAAGPGSTVRVAIKDYLRPLLHLVLSFIHSN